MTAPDTHLAGIHDDHCIDWDALNVAVRHDEEALRAALEDLAGRGLRSVILIGGGEPTLYPGFRDMVRFLKGLDLQVAVVSNGSRNEHIAEVADAFTAGDWVRLSLDSGSDEVFQAMHHPKGRGIALDEICERAGAIKRANPAVQLGYSFVITWRGSRRDDVAVVENLHEMESAARRARDAGFDYISFKPFLTRAAEGAEVLDPRQAEAELDAVRARIREGLVAAGLLQDERFRVVESTNLRVFLDGTWQEYTRQPSECHMQALRQVFSPLGTYNCPAHRGVDRARIGGADAWTPASPGGDRGGAAGTARLLDGFDASRECAEVTCLYNPVNRWLETLVAGEDDPETAVPHLDDAIDTFL
jgi:MoaA/NifB/PqqE/SkfB family radical SAM enzyme